MFERILLPLDFSEQSMLMLDHVMELRSHGANEAILLNVRDRDDEASAEERKMMDAATSLLNEQGLIVRSLFLKGDPVEIILEVADKEEVDIISMASSGKGRSKEFLLGSTSFGVIRRSNKPLLIDKLRVEVKDGHMIVDHFNNCILRKALVPIDLTPCSKTLADHIGALHRYGLKESVLFHVVESARFNEDDSEHFLSVEKRLNEIKEVLTAQGHDVTTHVHFGTTTYNILEAAKELDASIIVLGIRRKNLRVGAASRIDSEEVARKASGPILIVPC